MRKILNVEGDVYVVLGVMNVDRATEKGAEYWKERWSADSILRRDHQFYFCQKVIDAEFEDI